MELGLELDLSWPLVRPAWASERFELGEARVISSLDAVLQTYVSVQQGVAPS